MDKRLEAILSFLSPTDKMIDIGTDHAYIPIFMAEKKAQKILATDIHENALKIAQKNIHDKGFDNIIETKLADGLKTIDSKEYDTLVVAGMGTSTIKKILSDSSKLENIKKIIIQTNNDLPDMRKFMMQIGYSLHDEKVVLERNHYYTIMYYIKKKESCSSLILTLGLYKKEHLSYYKYLKEKWENLLKTIPEKEEKRRREIILLLDYINIYLQKEDRI